MSCPQCGRARRATLCPRCVAALRLDLADVPALLDELEITRARQDQPLALHARGHGGGGESPLPYRPRTAIVVTDLHRALSTVARELGLVGAHAATTAQTARWLRMNLLRVRSHPQAGRLAQELTSAIRGARDAIDHHRDPRSRLGPCGVGDCPGQLHAAPDDPTAVCPRCGTTHPVATRQARLRDAARDHLGSAVEVAAVLRLLGVRCTPSMVRNHVARGRLSAANEPERQRHVAEGRRPPRALYSVGDVIATLGNRYQRRKVS